MQPLPVRDIDSTLDRACEQAVDHHLAGELAEAEQLYRAVLQVRPRHANAAYGFGMLRVQRGEPAAALPILRAVVEGNAQVSEYWLAYLDALLLAGQADEASRVLDIGRSVGLAGPEIDALATRIAAQRAAASTPVSETVVPVVLPEAAPEGAEAVLPIEAILELLSQGQLEQALHEAGRLCRQDPAHGMAWKVLGSLQWVVHKDPASAVTLRRACTLLPADTEVRHNLVQTLIADKAWAEAERVLREILQLAPDTLRSQADLAGVLRELQRSDEALPLAVQVCAAAPDDAKHHLLLARIGMDLGQFNLAADSYRTGIALAPEQVEHYTEFLFALTSFPHLSPAELFAEHVRFGAHLAARVHSRLPPPSNSREPDRELRIGIVSADLRFHPVEVFVEPMLQRLSLMPGYRIHAYYNFAKTDPVSDRLRHYFSDWLPCIDLDDDTLAARIRADQIDILIDLNGHTGFNRLALFAQRVAPVQLSWLGYVGTTGVHHMDYYLTDPGLLPHGRFDEIFTEKLLRVPAAAAGFNAVDLPDVNPLPALASGVFTFGSFNRSGKLNSETLSLWARVLAAVPESRLLLGQVTLEVEQRRIRATLEKFGVAAERVVFLPKVPLNGYLLQHHEVDLCLDAFPYGGGTTTIRAISLGVPTVTIAGATPASRLSTAAMLAYGFPQFIVDSPDAFVACAADWAGRVAELAHLRATIREHVQQQPLLDPDRVTAWFDLAMRAIWRRWCEDLPPVALDITPDGQVITR